MNCYFYTFGCKVNTCETAGMQSLLFERDRLWDVYRALGSYVSSSGYQCADDQQIIRLIPAR